MQGSGDNRGRARGLGDKGRGNPDVSKRVTKSRCSCVCALNITENQGWCWSENGVKGRRKQMKSFEGRGSWALGILACQ